MSRKSEANKSPAGAPAAPAPLNMGQWIKFRLGLVFVVFVALFSVIVFRLVQLQIIVNPDLENLAQRQFQKVNKKAPYRLPIYDRNREELAVSIPASSVFARPREMRQKRLAAKTLSKTIGGSFSHWLKKLSSDKPFIWIHRKLSEETAKALTKKNLAGIYIEPENKRIYPNGQLAAPTLGFTDIDGNGLSGLELSLNEELLQKESRNLMTRDGRGNPSYIDSKYRPPDDGKAGVYATIDRRLQHAVEEELDRGMEETGARGMMAAVMDPYTGELFAIAQRPTFDPNRPSDFSPTLFGNGITSGLYEPGSTMKPLMAAEAIQNGLLTPQSQVFCEHGEIFFGKRRIGEAEAHEKFGWLSVDKVIRFSSNIGAVKIAQTLGTDRVRFTLDKFGLTSKTGISLPGEANLGPRGDDYWKPIYLATVGFGQGVSVTPLQMLTAYAPFANGGYLVRPRILLRENEETTKLQVRRVLSPATVQAMREIMVGVTEAKGGTGSNARVAELRVAGKTGTAQKYEAGIGYKSKKYFSSFVGYLPADQPELLIGVWVDEPKRGGYTGGAVAAPVFKRVAERALQILDRIPKKAVGRPAAVATTGKPAAPAETPKVEMAASPDGKWIMPDLKGTSVREALHAVGKYLPNLKLTGDGYLETQTPKAGALVSPQTAVTLHFVPTPAG